jgi:copper chaperone CopZ
MKHTYNITGMTCGNCKASVEKHLSELKNVTSVIVDLDKGEVEVEMNMHVPTEILQKESYRI